MDLESELREAMAERVAGAEAPPSLVADVRRRHRRRQTRIRVTVGVAAAAVAVAVVAPGYQSFRADPVGSNGRPDDPGGKSAPPASPGPTVSGLPKSAAPAPGKSGKDGRPAGEDPAERGGEPSKGGIAGIKVPAWVTFLPTGLKAEAPCAAGTENGARTTTCRWRGPAGWVEIRLVRGSGLGGPEDLMKSPGVPRPASVRGERAITADRPDSGRQIAWMERPGLGVVVAAGGGTRDQLMRIAEGVRP
ncbi:hypothetical protein [Spirillospora sp. NPDC029432]|uniref:hypothetical protein n=1 Tax=Spirillospora sp. NPDC029432 TaxID=3154599 RepID=UPI0034573389